MKHFRKVSAVLLAALMVAVMLPSLGLFSTATNAAGVGELVNGDFSSGDFTGWDYNEWAVSISSGSARFTKDSSVANATALKQVVAVNTNATYTLTFKVKGGELNCESTPCFTYKVLGGTKADACSSQIAAGTPKTGSSYQSNSVSISTGSYKYIAIQFISTGTGDEDSYLDDVSLTVVSAGDTSTHAKPSFVDYGNELNRPNSASNNAVTQPSFESTTNAPWNVSTFIDNKNLSVVNDPDAKDGSKSLLYSNATNTGTWHYFDLDLPSGGNYVLSAWVKSPYLSATNQGTASIGLIDPDTNMFFMSGLANYKGHDSTPFSQIRSTATDNQWHLRSITFFVGSAGTVKIGVYGKMSQLYIDDISVHLESNGVKYTGDQTGSVSASSNSSNLYCEHEDNLIEDCNMGPNAANFWKVASGWNNGFMSFAESDATHGSVLKFNGTGPENNKIYHYIKWIYVEPNTKYTVSYDYRITAKGSGQLRFIDNNIDLPQVISNSTLSFSSATNDWATKSFTFNSGNYNRIGIVFTDGTGTALFDDFRIFKTEDGISQEPPEAVYPTLQADHPEKYVSRMEMSETGKLGLGFLFNLEATGVTRNNKFEADYTNGKVQAFEDGTDYKLVKAGAVMTNDETVGQNPDIFVLENVNSENTLIDVSADKLFYDPNNAEHVGYGTHIYFAVRIVNIPETHKNTAIYARPYYIFEYNGRQITVYGDVEWQSYEPMKDVNDGWLEWD